MFSIGVSRESEDGARILLEIRSILMLEISSSLHLLVAHDLMLKLQLKFEELDFFLVLLDFILQISDLMVLGRVAQNSWPHRKVLIDVTHVPHR